MMLHNLSNSQHIHHDKCPNMYPSNLYCRFLYNARNSHHYKCHNKTPNIHIYSPWLIRMLGSGTV